MPVDPLHDIASKLDAKIGQFMGKKPGESAMSPEVISILKEGGCADSEGTLAKIEAAGFKIEKTGEPEPKDEAEKEIGKSPGASLGMEEDTSAMPMKDARNSAAKFAFDKMK